VADEPEPRVEPSLLEQAQELLRDGAAAPATEVAAADDQEPEPAPEPVAQAQPEEAVVAAQPEVTEAEPEPELAVAPEMEAEPEAEEEPEVAAQEPDAELDEEQAPEPAQPERIILRRSTDQPQKKPKRRVRRPRFQYVRDERLESLDQTEKEKSRKKKRRLVVDEETGKLVQRPRHKHEDEQEWGGGS
jgi:hypothetical protein